MFKKTIVSLLIISFFSISKIFAQGYGTAAGIRFGDGIGLTVQQQVALKTTAEVIVKSGLTTKDVTGTLLIEQHTNILTRALNFYSGVGAYHTWYAPNDNLKVSPTNPTGIAFIAGAEIKLGGIVVSADVKPSLKIMGDGTGFDWQTGVSVRYIIAPRIFRKKWWTF